jgi:hypothetical protein
MSCICTGIVLGMLSWLIGVLVAKGDGIGVVEALSMSIIVGMSVDYCVHQVRGLLRAPGERTIACTR